MIRMMTAALLLNTDMGIYFFVLPYLSSGLGMSQSEIGLLTAVHSVCYIAVTCLSGCAGTISAEPSRRVGRFFWPRPYT